MGRLVPGVRASGHLELFAAYVGGRDLRTTPAIPRDPRLGLAPIFWGNLVPRLAAKLT